ncbi:MAG: hydrogenase maturation protease [Gammaproteobacteria bacterium]|nr:MAG: hydrogenase maturation protease [Gammaproteobacteria bacterium]
MSTTLILGIGNTLLSDEGIGIHIIDHIAVAHHDIPGITCLDGGTLSFTLAGPIAEHDNLIVIDAARLDIEPGGYRTFTGDEMDRYLTGDRQSVHEVGLADLLDIARLSDTFPWRRALIGIQPRSLDWGDGPTPEVARSIPAVAKVALDLHLAWQTE